MERISLQEYQDLAYRAYYWSSFSPDKRGQQCVASHEEELNSDLEDMPEHERERYTKKYIELYTACLSSSSRCASSAITGGSNFPVARQRKYHNWYEGHVRNFIEWRKKALSSIAKRIERDKPAEQKEAEAWEELRKTISHSAAVIKQINEGTYCGYKALFVNSIYSKVETFAKHGNVDAVTKALDLIRELNKVSSIITERHKFFKLLDVANLAIQKDEEAKTTENGEVTFNGGVMVQNHAENRLQLIFDEKPNPQVISSLKKSAFRWSPRFGAWQRQLTGNAERAARVVLCEHDLLAS